MKDCSICKYSDEDFAFDAETGEEYPVYDCQKGNDTSLDCECKDFKKYKPRKYREKDTECDKCEYREKCAKYSSEIDCTTNMYIEAYFSCHGGITFADGGENSNYPIESDLWWFGFDCAHCDDAKELRLAYERLENVLRVIEESEEK